MVPAEEHTVAEEAATVAEGEAVALTFRSDDVDGVESARGGLQERQEEVRVRLQSEVAELEAELALASQKDDEATHAAQRALSDLEAARREAEEAAAEPAKKKKGGLFSRAFGMKGATTPPRSREPEEAARQRVGELERELATRRAAAEEMALARRAIAQQRAEAGKAASALGVGLGEQERKLRMQLEGARASSAAKAIPAAAGAGGEMTVATEVVATVVAEAIAGAAVEPEVAPAEGSVEEEAAARASTGAEISTDTREAMRAVAVTTAEGEAAATADAVAAAAIEEAVGMVQTEALYLMFMARAEVQGAGAVVAMAKELVGLVVEEATAAAAVAAEIEAVAEETARVAVAKGVVDTVLAAAEAAAGETGTHLWPRSDVSLNACHALRHYRVIWLSPVT